MVLFIFAKLNSRFFSSVLNLALLGVKGLILFLSFIVFMKVVSSGLLFAKMFTTRPFNTTFTRKRRSLATAKKWMNWRQRRNGNYSDVIWLIITQPWTSYERNVSRLCTKFYEQFPLIADNPWHFPFIQQHASSCACYNRITQSPFWRCKESF